MDMACFGRTDKEVQQELDRRRKLGVRNVKVSPLFEVGKRYNIDERSPLHDKEDPNGTMVPEWPHCWLTWESRWLDFTESESGYERWSTESYDFPSLEKANLAAQYLLGQN